MEPVQEIELNSDLVAKASRNIAMFSPGDSWIEGEIGVVLVKTHQGSEVIVDRDIDVHAAGNSIRSVGTGLPMRKR